MEESIYCKVPLLAIPFYGDQQANVDSMVSKGLGLSLDHHNIEKSIFKAAILEVISNKTYVNINYLLIYNYLGLQFAAIRQT